MGPISFVCFLVYSCQMQGSSAVTPRFVLTGKDLLLDILSPVVVVENSDFKWKFQLNVTHNENVLKLYYGNKTKISVRYEGRTKISLQNYSLHLRNMQQADSGLYSAWINVDKDQCVGEYNVTVQDPVSPVELTVDYVSNSSDSCNLAVTCSTRDSHHINNLFTCDSKNCSHEEGGERSKVTTSGASLRVYLGDDSSIVCEHSNQVSSAKNNSMIEHFCPKTAYLIGKQVIIIVIVVAIIIVIAAAVFYHQKKRKSKSDCKSY
ncbi:putative SLAM family member 9-like [Scophthalmus maximus]|uniref:Putative SLAM family member 9-like n=1 Tax=Scophthalmus maximus TaxID=52904 RepID=A0A2U9BIA9_SCOMX|nr:putative SLAM family member 9-like [Scophthalmus maximus]